MATTSRPRRQRPLKATREVGMSQVDGITAEEALKTYDGTFLDCRDIRHSWLRQGFWSEGGQLKRKLFCSRCGTERTDIWSFDGRERVAGRYDYPDGYIIAGTGHNTAAADVRHEAVSRATIFDSEQTMIESLIRKGGRK